MKTVIEILKQVGNKFCETWTYFGMHLKEFIKKLIQNFRKIRKIFPGNF